MVLKDPELGISISRAGLSCMSIRHRQMIPNDVRECAEIIATHPVIGPRYGDRIGDLCSAWLRLIRLETKRATIFQTSGPRAPICFIGVSVFVSDDFVRELKAPPGFWIGPELLDRILHGDSPIHSDSQFREANSRGGLNLLVWEGCIRPGFETVNEIQRHIMSRFIEEHSGFLLKEVIGSQMESVERFRWTLQTGGLLWNPLAGRYVKSFKKDPKEIIRKPHVIGVTREIELARPDSWACSWVGALFDYHPPQCGFTRSEQRMLLMALDGGTDRELAQKLGVSIPTVKKMWSSVYRRVADHLPELNPNHSPSDMTIRRGKEKKRGVVAYLREHLEELRSFSPRLSEKSAAITGVGANVRKNQRLT